MKVGTKSLLFGAHQFMIHPWFVAIAWAKLYGFPRDPRLWLCFFLHDIGYIGKENMDGPEGERHPELGASIVGAIFGREWRDFCLYHSRYYARRDGRRYSKLCIADKLAVALTPAWLYIPMAMASGEIWEYMALAGDATAKYGSAHIAHNTKRSWFASVQEYLRAYALAHKEGEEDTWTPITSEAGKR